MATTPAPPPPVRLFLSPLVRNPIALPPPALSKLSTTSPSLQFVARPPTPSDEDSDGDDDDIEEDPDSGKRRAESDYPSGDDSSSESADAGGTRISASGLMYIHLIFVSLVFRQTRYFLVCPIFRLLVVLVELPV